MGAREEERVRVPTGDVGHAGEEEEEAAGDERHQGDPLDRVGHVAERRPRPEAGEDGPELGEEDRDRHEPGRHVHALRDAVQAGRAARPLEPARGVLDEVREQTGEEAGPERHTEGDAEHRGAARLVQLAGEAALHLRHDVSWTNHRPSSAWVHVVRSPAARAMASMPSMPTRAHGNHGPTVVALLDPSPGDDGGEAGRLDLGEHPTVTGEDLPKASQQPGGIAPDPDVPVDQERGAPPTLAGQRLEHGAVEHGAAAPPRRVDGARRRVDAERDRAPLGQRLRVAPGPAADVEDRADGAGEHGGLLGRWRRLPPVQQQGDDVAVDGAQHRRGGRRGDVMRGDHAVDPHDLTDGGGEPRVRRQGRHIERVGDGVDVAQAGQGRGPEAELAEAGHLPRARVGPAHRDPTEHGRVGATKSDGPPAAVLRRSEDRVGVRLLERGARQVEEGRRHLRGVHADLERGTADVAPRGGQTFAEARAALADHVDARRQPWARLAVEGEDDPIGRAGERRVERVDQCRLGDECGLLRGARRAEPRLHPTGHRCLGHDDDRHVGHGKNRSPSARPRSCLRVAEQCRPPAVAADSALRSTACSRSPPACWWPTTTPRWPRWSPAT